MNRPLRALALLLSFSLALAPSAYAVEQRPALRDAPFWFWLMGYDRSPNAVRARFNDLMEADENGRDLTADRATMSSQSDFEFRGERDELNLTTAATQLSLTGTVGADGAVSDLALDLAPVSGLSQAYIAQSSTAMKAAMYALFDDLNQRETKQLALIFRYDLSPFRGGEVKAKARSAQAVIKGACLALGTSAQHSGAVCLDISFLGLATPEQMKQARVNNACNAKLHQAEGECANLLDCAQALEEVLRVEPVDRAEALAVLDQMDETLQALREMRLFKYRKTAAYAREMRSCAERAAECAKQARDALTAGNADADAGKSLVKLAEQMQALTDDL